MIEEKKILDNLSEANRKQMGSRKKRVTSGLVAHMTSNDENEFGQGTAAWRANRRDDKLTKTSAPFDSFFLVVSCSEWGRRRTKRPVRT
jgi:hypothetical protein